MSRKIQKLIQSSLLVLVLVVSYLAVAPTSQQTAYAQTCYNHNGTTPLTCQNPAAHNLQPGKCYTQRTARDGSVQGYSETSCNDATDRNQDGIAGGRGSAAEDRADNADCKETSLNAGNCGIVRYLLMFINMLSAAVGIVVVIMIAVGGVQYTMSKDNPQQAAAAKDHIRNALIALLMYLFMFSFLQWLVPGGIF